MRLRSVLALALCPVLLLLAQPTLAQETARDRLIIHLTAKAREQTAQRRAVMEAVVTPEQARLRQVEVRALLAELIGSQRAAGPVRAEVTGRSDHDGFSVDALWYESLPGYRVTADLYRPPAGDGPFPAIIMQPGHGVDGKLGNHAFAANLARAGFIVLSIDIVGEGERIQHYDPEIGASKVGRPTGEHSMAFGQALPTGGHVSRWFIGDAMRGVDYLASLPEVDGRRIGAFGCSGGGTITAYLAALDPRIAATATACYVNDYDHLLAAGGPGPQDAEQSIPFFLERGLDLPDWIEAAAPRPYAVVSTTGDMFPIDGARAAYTEAKRFYSVMGAGERITMIEGPGGHGNLQPIAPQIIGFFNRWLRDDATEPAFVTVPAGNPALLLATPTGQLSTSPDGGDTLQAVIARAAPAQVPTPADPETLRQAIREVARVHVLPGDAAPAMQEGAPVEIGDLRAVPLSFAAAPGLPANALYVTASGSGRRPTLLVLQARPEAILRQWHAAGWNVLALEPRGAGGTEEAKSPLTGDWTLLSLRAMLVGETPVGMRTDDALAALNWLATRPEVGPIEVLGTGALAPVALHVGVLDDRVAGVTAVNGILRYRDFAERPISRDMAEVNLPGVLARYDLPDLLAALGDRVVLVNPVNSVGEPLRAGEVAALLPAPPRVIFQGSRDPILPPAR